MNQEAFNSYRLFMPKQAVGADLVYFDLFNRSDTGLDLLVNAVIPIVSGAVAVVGTLGVDLLLTRTSAVGTGGTAATREGTSTTAATFANMTAAGQPLDGGVTARLTPTGGATAGAVIAWTCVFTEETSDATYVAQNTNLVRRLGEDCGPLIVPPNTGLRVVQGAVASVGNIGFDVLFRTRPR
jgi:hypothetical protein